ncbi:MAG: DNA polymerase III subunit [Vicinamibacterales bacterium]
MSFRHLFGHQRQVRLLSRAIARETVPPTLLFAGPTGIGKWRVAQAVAQAMNCLAPIRSDDSGALAYDACGACRACDRIARGVHVDVVSVEPDEKASIKIDVVRDVLARTAYRPFEGRRRAILIREADTLETQAQNALLKSLEEPPPATVFILTSAVPGALLPTVRSRSMTMRFARLTVDEVAGALVRDHEATDADARAMAGLADGSIGQALALGASDVAVLRETALLMLQESARRTDVQGRLQVAAAVVGSGGRKERPRTDLAMILRLTASMLRDIEAINGGADSRVLANPVVADELSAVARDFSGDRARDAFAAVDRALAALERNAATKAVAEWLATQI